MSSQPPYALLKAEIQHLKEVNAELLKACEAALDREIGEVKAISMLKNAIAKAKAS